MKVYSIGRDTSCNIVVNDRSDVISRRHAILTVYPSGKMTITDQSQNGTYVNGIRISSNVAVPVTRKDNVSLAHVARLDWNQVPNPGSTLKIAIISLIVAALIGGGIFGYLHHKSEIEAQEALKKEQVEKDKAAKDQAEKEKAEKEKAEKEKAEKEKAEKEKAEKEKAKKDKSKKDTKEGKDKPTPASTKETPKETVDNPDFTGM